MNINRVVLVGNLTRDPELKQAGQTSVCKMRIAVNTRCKDSEGNWADKPNFFDVTAFGKQAESCAEFLAKGKPCAIDGRLEWHEWESDGVKRQSVEIIADNVQFLGGKDTATSTNDDDLF
jgi:single-strand DNA-binding protein